MAKGVKYIYDQMHAYLKKTFAVDLRSLALMRMALGLVILFDLIDRMRFLSAFYTDVGTAPRHGVLAYFDNPYWFSLHHLSGDLFMQALLFVVHMLITLCLIIGLRTRLMTFLSWLFCVSLTNRNPGIIFGGDNIVRMVLFWSMFVPLGLHYSVDAALNTVKYAYKRFFNAGCVGLLSQVLIIYFFAALLKHHPQWTTDGTALALTLELDQFVTPFGIWLRQFSGLLRMLTHATVVLEFAGPVLLLLPFWREHLRLWVVFAFCGLHLGILLSMNVGLFSWMCMAVWVVFLPTSFWAFWASRQTSSRGLGYTVFYDQDCGFCRKGVHVLKTFLRLNHLQIKTGQSENGVYTRMQQDHSWVVRGPDGVMSTRYQAFLQMLRASPWPVWVCWCFSRAPVDWVGSGIYHWVSHNRSTMGKVTSWMHWRAQAYRPRIWSKYLVIFFLLEVVMINLDSLDWPDSTVQKWLTPMQITAPVRGALRIGQHWGLFAPHPTADDGWYVIYGKTIAGDDVNLWQTDYQDRYSKPDNVSKTFINHRWRKYLRNIRDGMDPSYRKYFGTYLCHKANAHREGDDQLDVVKIKFMHERTTLGEPYPIEEHTLWTHLCFGKVAPVNKIFEMTH